MKIQTVQTFEQVLRMQDLANRVFFGGKRYFEYRFPHLYSKDNFHNLYYIEEDGEICSSIVVFHSEIETADSLNLSAASVGAVCTREDCRGRGFSGAILEHIIQNEQQKGTELLFISGEGKLYRKKGAVRTGVLYEYVQESKDCTVTMDEGLSFERLFRTEQIPLETLERLYMQKPNRFLRSNKQWETFLQGNLFCCGDEKNEICIVSHDGKVTGYLFARTVWEGPLKVVLVNEMSGCSQHLLAAARMIMNQEKADKLLLRYEIPEEIPQELKDKVCKIPVTGTILILDADKLLYKLQPIAQKRLSMPCRVENVSGEYRLYVNDTQLFAGGKSALTCYLLDEPQNDLQKAWNLPSIRVDTLNFI